MLITYLELLNINTLKFGEQHLKFTEIESDEFKLLTWNRYPAPSVMTGFSHLSIGPDFTCLRQSQEVGKHVYHK